MRSTEVYLSRPLARYCGAISFSARRGTAERASPQHHSFPLRALATHESRFSSLDSRFFPKLCKTNTTAYNRGQTRGLTLEHVFYIMNMSHIPSPAALL